MKRLLFRSLQDAVSNNVKDSLWHAKKQRLRSQEAVYGEAKG